MEIILFSFTRQASKLSLILYEYFSAKNTPCTSFTMEKYATVKELTPLTKPLKEQVSQCFQRNHVLIFISACGIAVRSIAPFLQEKTSDPCVLVIDEKGQFVISLLSGHMGGGNDFAKQAASVLHATAVISTATDINHCFSVDTFAKENNLALSDMTLAKKISADLLEHIPIGISGNIPKGSLPEGITLDNAETGFCISPFFHSKPFYHTLFLIPKQVVLGMGCKKNTTFSQLREFVDKHLAENYIFPESIAAIASIDLKKEEQGLWQLSSHYQVPFRTYDKDTLLEVAGNFTGSDFVQSITGVDNVCERSALAYAPQGKLLLSKVCCQGMTLAIALLPPKTLYFDDKGQDIP